MTKLKPLIPRLGETNKPSQLTSSCRSSTQAQFNVVNSSSKSNKTTTQTSMADMLAKLSASAKSPYQSTKNVAHKTASKTEESTSESSNSINSKNKDHKSVNIMASHPNAQEVASIFESDEDDDNDRRSEEQLQLANFHKIIQNDDSEQKTSKSNIRNESNVLQANSNSNSKLNDISMIATSKKSNRSINNAESQAQLKKHQHSNAQLNSKSHSDVSSSIENENSSKHSSKIQPKKDSESKQSNEEKDKLQANLSSSEESSSSSTDDDEDSSSASSSSSSSNSSSSSSSEDEDDTGSSSSSESSSSSSDSEEEHAEGNKKEFVKKQPQIVAATIASSLMAAKSSSLSPQIAKANGTAAATTGMITSSSSSSISPSLKPNVITMKNNEPFNPDELNRKLWQASQREKERELSSRGVQLTKTITPPSIPPKSIPNAKSDMKANTSSSIVNMVTKCDGNIKSPMTNESANDIFNTQTLMDEQPKSTSSVVSNPELELFVSGSTGCASDGNAKSTPLGVAAATVTPTTAPPSLNPNSNDVNSYSSSLIDEDKCSSNHESSADERNVTLTDLIETMRSPIKPRAGSIASSTVSSSAAGSNPSSTNTSPQLPSFSANINSSNALNVKSIRGKQIKHTDDISSENAIVLNPDIIKNTNCPSAVSVSSLGDENDDAIRFELDDEEIGDDSNASNHNLQNVIKMQNVDDTNGDSKSESDKKTPSFQEPKFSIELEKQKKKLNSTLKTTKNENESEKVYLELVSSNTDSNASGKTKNRLINKLKSFGSNNSNLQQHRTKSPSVMTPNMPLSAGFLPTLNDANLVINQAAVHSSSSLPLLFYNIASEGNTNEASTRCLKDDHEEGELDDDEDEKIQHADHINLRTNQEKDLNCEIKANREEKRKQKEMGNMKLNFQNSRHMFDEEEDELKEIYSKRKNEQNSGFSNTTYSQSTKPINETKKIKNVEEKSASTTPDMRRSQKQLNENIKSSELQNYDQIKKINKINEIIQNSNNTNEKSKEIISINSEHEKHINLSEERLKELRSRFPESTPSPSLFQSVYNMNNSNKLSKSKEGLIRDQDFLNQSKQTINPEMKILKQSDTNNHSSAILLSSNESSEYLQGINETGRLNGFSTFVSSSTNSNSNTTVANATSTNSIGDHIEYSADGRPKLIVSIELDLLKILNINQLNNAAVAATAATASDVDLNSITESRLHQLQQSSNLNETRPIEHNLLVPLTNSLNDTNSLLFDRSELSSQANRSEQSLIRAELNSNDDQNDKKDERVISCKNLSSKSLPIEKNPEKISHSSETSSSSPSSTQSSLSSKSNSKQTKSNDVLELSTKPSEIVDKKPKKSVISVDSNINENSEEREIAKAVSVSKISSSKEKKQYSNKSFIEPSNHNTKNDLSKSKSSQSKRSLSPSSIELTNQSNSFSSKKNSNSSLASKHSAFKKDEQSSSNGNNSNSSLKRVITPSMVMDDNEDDHEKTNSSKKPKLSSNNGNSISSAITSLNTKSHSFNSQDIPSSSSISPVPNEPSAGVSKTKSTSAVDSSAIVSSSSQSSIPKIKSSSNLLAAKNNEPKLPFGGHLDRLKSFVSNFN
jgi:trimeric autotransporter adhesin